MSTREACSQVFSVLPGDLDAFGHMNNGRYLQIMDVARLRWLLRTGTVAAIRRNGWRVALGGNITRFRRPLSLFRRYRVHSSLLCWDQRWFYLEHIFQDKAGKVLSIGMSRAAFRCKGRWVGTQEVMDEVDPGAVSIPLPAHVRRWMEAEELLHTFCTKRCGPHRESGRPESSDEPTDEPRIVGRKPPPKNGTPFSGRMAGEREALESRQ